MEKFFKLKENGTTFSREIVAGLTTFFAMAYIIVVNPTLLQRLRNGVGRCVLATIIASIIGTLMMGLVANVPYAQAPGMGLNAFFVYTVCFGLGFTWQQALSMVFICGLINIHHHRDQDPQVHHQVHPPQPPERHWRRHRHLRRLHRPPERGHSSTSAPACPPWPP